MPIGTKLGGMVTYVEGLLIINSHGPLITWYLQKHATNLDHYISTITVPMATILDIVVTYLKELLPTKPHSS